MVIPPRLLCCAVLSPIGRTSIGGDRHPRCAASGRVVRGGPHRVGRGLATKAAPRWANVRANAVLNERSTNAVGRRAVAGPCDPMCRVPDPEPDLGLRDNPPSSPDLLPGHFIPRVACGLRRLSPG